jgi:hypothetical protein
MYTGNDHLHKSVLQNRQVWCEFGDNSVRKLRIPKRIPINLSRFRSIEID